MHNHWVQLFWRFLHLEMKSIFVLLNKNVYNKYTTSSFINLMVRCVQQIFQETIVTLVGYKLHYHLWPFLYNALPILSGLYVNISISSNKLQTHQTTKFRFIQALAWWGQREELFCLVREESYKKECTWKCNVNIIKVNNWNSKLNFTNISMDLWKGLTDKYSSEYSWDLALHCN